VKNEEFKLSLSLIGNYFNLRIFEKYGIFEKKSGTFAALKMRRLYESY